LSDGDCISFLQWCLPQLGMRWAGFRKVRRQICKRINGRISELNLTGHAAYREYLSNHPDEWNILDSLCFVTISRFYRDKIIFQIIGTQILPRLVKQVTTSHRKLLQIWSAGCCCGEEPYTLKILWELAFRNHPKFDANLHITATDHNEQLLQRANTGKYTKGSIKELPEPLLKQAFRREGQYFCIKHKFKAGINFQPQDIRRQLPDQMFDLILCRNLVFTYFDHNLQKDTLDKLADHLHGGGFLIIGAHEKLPFDHPSLVPFENHSIIFQKVHVTK